MPADPGPAALMIRALVDSVGEIEDGHDLMVAAAVEAARSGLRARRERLEQTRRAVVARADHSGEAFALASQAVALIDEEIDAIARDRDEIELLGIVWRRRRDPL